MHTVKIVLETTCIEGPLVLETTCIEGPLVLETTCIEGPLVLETTCIEGPLVYSYSLEQFEYAANIYRSGKGGGGGGQPPKSAPGMYTEVQTGVCK